MDERELIKNKIDIVELISSYIPLKKAGRNFRTTCPFHSEKTPSFTVSPERQIWKCFGCGKAGDIFGFLIEYEKMTFGEAIRTLAARAGVKLEYHGKSQEKKDLEEIIFEINHLASEFYNYVLTSTTVGKRALDYLEKRGITKDSVRLFKIGYAPNSWESLTRFLKKKGYTNEQLTKSAVAAYGVGEPKDRFYGRLMFSLFDHRGNCVGFAGRVLPSAKQNTAREEAVVKMGKYINTSETPVYHKSEVLYGFNVTKDHVRQEDSVVIVEGEIDLIKVYQSGTKNVVAIKGSALTEQQVVLLKRFTRNLKICLDTDLAGKMAALRGIAIAEKSDMNIKVIELLEGKDPDDCVSRDVALWKKSLDAAIDIYDFYIKIAKEQFNLNEITGKKKFTEFVFPKIDEIANLVVRDHYMKKLARLMGVSEEVVAREMEELAKRQKMGKAVGREREAGESKKWGRREKLEEHLLSLILQSDDAKRYIDQIVANDLDHSLEISTPILQKIFARLVDFVEHDVFTIQNFISKIPPELHDKVDELYLKDLGFDNLLDILKKEVEGTVREIQKLHLKEKIEEVMRQMRKTDDDTPEFAALNVEFQKLSGELKTITK